MADDQRAARVFGVLFILTFLTSIPAALLFQTVVDDPTGFMAGEGSDATIYLAAFLELLLVLANLGTAIVLYPIARRHHPTLAVALAALKDWSFLFGPGLVVPFGNGLLLGYLMYRSGLAPRPLTWLGLVGGPVLLVGNLGVLFDLWEDTGAMGLLVAPEILWELSLGIYAAVWGFRRTAPVLAER